MSSEAYSYLEEALQIMEENFVYKENVNWDVVRKEVYATAENAVFPSDTYPAIRRISSLINDRHGFFLSAAQWELLKENAYIKPPIYRLVEGNIAYIALFELPTGSPSPEEYTKQVQTAIRKLDGINVDKWIIDLRKNSGGNMWPMLLGLGPLLDEGCVGFFSGKDRSNTGWYYENNAIREEDYYVKKKGNTVKQKGYYLENPMPLYKLKNKPNIAIIIANSTIGSGEDVAVAFSGQQNVRFFGQHTAGFTTANEGFLLRDGAYLFFPIAHCSNRLGQIFYAGVTPDETINQDEINLEGKDPTIEAAISWLCKIEK